MSDFNQTWPFSTDFSKNTQIPNKWISSFASELFHSERQTDWRTGGRRDRHGESNSLFSKVVNAPKMSRAHPFPYRNSKPAIVWRRLYHWDNYFASHFAAYKLRFFFICRCINLYLEICLPLEHTACSAAVTSTSLRIRVFLEVALCH